MSAGDAVGTRVAGVARGADSADSAGTIHPATGAALPAGSLIGIVAPAGPTSPERLAQVAPMFEARGYRVRLYPSCSARHETLPYLAGSDAQRVADLHAALADDEVAAILCLRGGYGCMRLLQAVDATLVRTQRKLLAGYSDITALLALWSREGAPALHAPMATSDIVLPERSADREAFFALLRRGVRVGDVLRLAETPTPTPTPSQVQSPSQTQAAAAAAAPSAEDLASITVPGLAEGRLVGGNLSLLAALQGTPFAWPADEPTLLFIEDVGEEPYRIDRLLTQLGLAGALEAATGFVLGSFTQQAYPLEVLRDRLLPLGKPVLAGWPAGHGVPNQPLPLGLRMRLDARAGTLTLLQGWGAPRWPKIRPRPESTARL